MEDETRELLVWGDALFKIKVPADAQITFGPFSPPRRDGYARHGDLTGTLRIYLGNKQRMIGLFTNVRHFRDITLGYEVIEGESEFADRTWIQPDMEFVEAEVG